jgi:hypothetical protein
MLSQINISKAKQFAARRRLANFVRHPNIMHEQGRMWFICSITDPLVCRVYSWRWVQRWFARAVWQNVAYTLADGLDSLQQVWRWDRCYGLKLALIEWVTTNTHVSCNKRPWDSTPWPLDYEAYIVWRGQLSLPRLTETVIMWEWLWKISHVINLQH